MNIYAVNLMKFNWMKCNSICAGPCHYSTLKLYPLVSPKLTPITIYYYLTCIIIVEGKKLGGAMAPFIANVGPPLSKVNLRLCSLHRINKLCINSYKLFGHYKLKYKK